LASECQGSRRGFHEEDDSMNGTAQNHRTDASASEPATQPQLQLLALGTTRIQSNGDSAKGASFSRKGRGILYLLALHQSHGLHKEVLMDTFWRGYCADSARNCLNVTLHGLRRALGQHDQFQQWVVFADDCYAINPTLALHFDVRDFEDRVRQARRYAQQDRRDKAIVAYGQALACYGGDFLEGEPYAEWAEVQRLRLAEQRLAALEALALLHELDGDASAAMRQWREILEIDACREDAHRGLMRCYAAEGQRVRALRQFERCREQLQREFGIEPESQSAALAEQIRSGNMLEKRPLAVLSEA
jgi:DNA-binding SARP family transcriptional activator